MRCLRMPDGRLPFGIELRPPFAHGRKLPFALSPETPMCLLVPDEQSRGAFDHQVELSLPPFFWVAAHEFFHSRPIWRGCGVISCFQRIQHGLSCRAVILEQLLSAGGAAHGHIHDAIDDQHGVVHGKTMFLQPTTGAGISGDDRGGMVFIARRAEASPGYASQSAQTVFALDLRKSRQSGESCSQSSLDNARPRARKIRSSRPLTWR